MTHHAYFYTGNTKEGIDAARAYAATALELTGTDNPNIHELSYQLFSVEDARKLSDTAYRSSTGGKKLIIVSMTRIFHEAQNALLKILEEPPEGATIILNVPSEGLFIPTLRSRLLSLPQAVSETGPVSVSQALACEFLAMSAEDRGKYAAKLSDRAKSDKEETKHEARREAIELFSGLMIFAHEANAKEPDSTGSKELRDFLTDINAFMPILYERSAPLKLMLEHVLLVIPKSLLSGKV